MIIGLIVINHLFLCGSNLLFRVARTRYLCCQVFIGAPILTLDTCINRFLVFIITGRYLIILV